MRTAIDERDALASSIVQWFMDGAHRRGAVLVGPAGVGTTSVAGLVGELLEAGGHTVVTVENCHLLTNAQFDELVKESTEPPSRSGRSTGGAEGRTIWLLTAHQGNALPRRVADWWAEGVIHRFDIAPLSVSDTMEMAEKITGAPLGRSIAAAIHEFCGGLPLYTREVLYELPRHHNVELVQGRWVRLAPILTAGPRLVDLAIQRLASLPDDARHAAEVMAVAGPIPASIAIDAIGEEALDDLLRRGLVRDNGRGHVALSPPALESGGRGSITLIRRVAIRHVLLASIEGRECPPELLIRIGQWAIGDGADASADVLVRAAESAVASGQNQIGADLAAAALGEEYENDLSVELAVRARLVLGRCRWYQGSMRAAIATLRPLMVDPTLGQVIVRGYEARALAAHIVSELLRFGLDSVENSDEVLSGIEDVGDPRSQQLIAVLRPVYAAYSGEFASALAQLDALATDPNITMTNRTWSVGAYILCLLEAGRTDDAVRIGMRSLQIAIAARLAEPFAMASIVSCLAYVQVMAGGPAQAIRQSVAEVSPLRGTFHYDEGTSQLGIGLMMMATGNVRGALDELLGAQAAMHLLDHSGLLRMTTMRMIEPAVLLGRAELAEELAARALTLPQRMSALSLVEQERGMLWLHHLRGGVSAVRANGEPLVERYMAEGLFGAALRVQHTMLRLGVVPEFERAEFLAGSVTGEHPAAIGDQLMAAARGDHRRLASTASRFERQGCLLLAAECLAMAEHFDVERSSSEARSTTSRKITELLRTTGDVLSPWLVGRTSSVPLTPRELEIATQVASGMSNSQVATQLKLKTRTVETHLQRVYEKLGIHRRAELATALTDL